MLWGANIKKILIIFILGAGLAYGAGFFLGSRCTYQAFGDGKCRVDVNAIVCDVFLF